MFLRTLGAPALVCTAVALLVGCGGVAEDPLLRLSAAEALEQGKALMADKKWGQARKYLIHAFEVEPNSRSGREGLILAADALFERGGFDAYVEAEQRYRDFLNRFPTSEQAPYAQFRVASSLARRTEKADRDQSITRKALGEFESMLRIYPTSEYAEQVREEMNRINDQLAEHEFVVGNFYLRYGAVASAGRRFQGLLDDFPEYSQKDKVLLKMCEGFVKSMKNNRTGVYVEIFATMKDACTRLVEEYPDSPYISKMPPKDRIDVKYERPVQESNDETTSPEESASSSGSGGPGSDRPAARLQ